MPIWRSKRAATSNAHVPASPGVYAIVDEEQVKGLAVGLTVLYVGKSNNLRRRLGEHAFYQEMHLSLRRHLRSRQGYVRLWYTWDVAPGGLDRLERQLIRELKPKFNRIKYRTQNTRIG